MEIVERNMSLAVMRGQVILPGSKSTSRAKGLHRKLGDPATDQRQEIAVGPHREGEEPTPMMHGNGKSDPAIVAVKPANKAERSASELVERRAEAKGNVATWSSQTGN